MKTIKVGFLIWFISLSLSACFSIETRQVRLVPQYNLEKNNEYAVVWNRTDIAKNGNMVSASGMILVLGQDKKKLVSSGDIFAINSLTGEDVWKTNAGYAGKIIASSERIYYGSVGSAYVGTYDVEDGKLIWKTSLPWAHSITDLYFAENKIFVNTSDSEFFILSEEGGILGNLFSSFPIYLEIDNVRYMNDNLAIKAVDLTSMQELWRVDVGLYDGAPIFDGGKIFITTWNNEIYSLDQATGMVNWEISGNMLSNLYIAEDKIYYMSEDYQLVSLDRATGEELSSIKFQPEFDMSVPRSGGFSIVGDPKNNVIAVSFANSDQIMGIQILNP